MTTPTVRPEPDVDPGPVTRNASVGRWSPRCGAWPPPSSPAGTPGGAAAARWLGGQLQSLGATVTADDFAVAGVRDVPATPVLTWIDAAGVGHRLVHRRDFAEHLVSA